MVSTRSLFVVAALVGSARASEAGTVIGKLDLPPPPPPSDRPPPATRGFLDRVDNPLAALRPINPLPYMVIVLDGGAAPAAPPQVVWELGGESFARPVIAVPTGAEVVIKNTSFVDRMLVADEDPALLGKAPLNQSGTRPFHAGAAGAVYTISDRSAPHVKGRVVVVGSSYIATPDDTGKFELADVAEGTYKVRVYYRDGWLDRADESITVPVKGKVDVNPKIPAGYPVAKKK